MSSRSDNINILKRVVHLLSSNKSTDVSDISHKQCSDAVGNLSISRVIKVSRIAASSAKQNLWLEFCDGSLECIHVDQTCFLIDIIGLGNEVVTACRYLFRLSLMTMGQVTTMS